jgi:hypothetical protein
MESSKDILSILGGWQIRRAGRGFGTAKRTKLEAGTLEEDLQRELEEQVGRSQERIKELESSRAQTNPDEKGTS